MIVILGQFKHPTVEAAAAALRDCVEGTKSSAAEPRCSVYGHALDAVDPTKIWAIHVWDDAKAMQEHMESDYLPPLAQVVGGSAEHVDLRQYVGEQSYYSWVHGSARMPRL